MTTEPPIDEGELLLRVARRDQAAFSMLYDRYASYVFGFICKMLPNPEEAEEVVHDVFTQIWNTANRYDASRGRVDTWIFTLARGRALDRLRSLKRVERVSEASEAAASLDWDVRVADPEEDLLASERRSVVLSALSTLPAAQRQALELAYYGDLSHSEIAQRTGEPVGTIKTRIRSGMSKLRESLAFLRAPGL